MKKYVSQIITLYVDNNIPTSSAALAYFLIMSIFPMLIIIYYLLGVFNFDILELTSYSQIISADTEKIVNAFIDYVSQNHNTFMLLMAISVILLTTSAGFRSLQRGIGHLQEGTIYKGIRFFLTSILIAVLTVLNLSLAIITMFLSEKAVKTIFNLLNIENVHLFIDLRYIVMFLMVLMTMCLLYLMCTRKNMRAKIFPGAFVSTVGMFVVTWVFSIFISASAKYPVVYGSLASIIILMFWLYCCSQAIYIGVIVNVIKSKQIVQLIENADG